MLSRLLRSPATIARACESMALSSFGNSACPFINRSLAPPDLATLAFLFALGEAGDAASRCEQLFETRFPLAGAMMLFARIEQIIQQHQAALDVQLSSSTSRCRMRVVGGS